MCIINKHMYHLESKKDFIKKKDVEDYHKQFKHLSSPVSYKEFEIVRKSEAGICY